MKKRFELLFGVILVPVDWVMLILSAVIAYMLRFQSSVTSLQPVVYAIPFTQFLGFAVITATAWIGVFALSGAYALRSDRKIMEEVRRVFFACSTGVLIIIVLFFFNRDLFSSRFIILVTYVCAIVCVTIGRLMVLSVQRALFERGVGVKHMAIIGEGHSAQLISTELSRTKRLGYAVVYQADAWTDEVERTLRGLVSDQRLDIVLLARQDRISKEEQAMYSFCDELHVTFMYAAALFDTQSSHMRIQPIAGLPVVEILRTPLDGWGRVLKRIFDVVFSLMVLIFGAPIYAMIAIAIVIDSGFPIIFSRKDDGTPVMRIGQYGVPFRYFKFRSMKPGTDSLRYSEELQSKNIRNGSPLVKIVDDPRITRVGVWLRRLSLDELLEFVLVLRGDMSVVGPRPHLPEEVAQYPRHAKRVLNMKPGITGLAQVSGRSDLTFEDEVRLDTFYMEHWSLLLDIILIVKTPFILFKKRKAL